jgi:low affinity Fe/Cu permease
VQTSRPLAFAIVGVYVIAWLFFSHRSLDWHGVATLATWVMTLFIQRAEHRDTQAIHAKLDELLRAEGKARDELTKLDEREPEEVEAHRKSEADNLA